MITRIWRIVCLLALLAAIGLAAPPDDLKRGEIRHWGPKQGFPEETIYSITETPDGYLWLASRDGLIRFDGLNFRSFHPGEGAGFRDNGLGGALAIGNSLWVGARDFVAYAQPDAFRSHTNLRFLATALPRDKRDRYGIASMQALPDGTLFFRRAEGVYRMQARADRQPPATPQFYLPAPAAEDLTGFCHGASGREWVSTPQGVYLRQGDAWVSPPGSKIRSATLLEARDGTLWAFGFDGLSFYRDGRFQAFPLPPKIAADPWRAIFEDRGGDLWVGLIGAMARIRAGKLELLPLEDTMRPGDFVKVISQSRDGALWAATSWGALIRVDRPVFRVFDSRDGLQEASIAAVTRDPSGLTWAGTRDKGVFYDAGSGFQPTPGMDRSILHAFLPLGDRSLLVANVEGLWWSGMQGATLLAGVPSHIMNHYRAFSPNYGTHVYYDDSQVLYRIALPIALPARPKLERVANVPLVRSILEASDGLWALSWDLGLCHIAADGTVRQHPLDPRQDIRAYTLFELSKEYFLVGTSAGLMVFDRRERQFLAQPPLFPTDQVFQILADDKEHIWFGARHALLAAKRDALLEYAHGERPTLLPFRLTGQQGLSSANFGLGTSSGSFFDSGKRIWMASVGGLIQFLPAEVVGLTENLPCAISEILADGIRLPVDSSVTLAPGIRRLEILYTVLNREADRNPVFRYRLEDHESAPWTETSLPQAGFTNVAPGNYKFQVQARLASFDWSPAVSMEVRVEPHWYERPSIRIAAVLMFCLLLYLAMRLRSRQVVARNIELEAKVLARTEELALARDAAEAAARAKANFLASMSHEIRTPMNGVVGMVEVLNLTPLNADQRRMLSVVSESSDALIAILNDILDFSKIEAGALRLECEPFCLPDLVHNCRELLLPQAAAKSLALEVTIAPEVPAWVMGDSTRVRQMILNLLSNAVKFTQQGRVGLTVRAVPGAGEISIAVSDTGIGVSPDKLDSIFEVFTQAESSTTRRFGGTGLGLSICRRIAAAMKGRLQVESSEGQGSVFTLWLPLPAAAPPQASTPPVATRRVDVEALAPHRRRKVLVVEDNAVNRQVASRLLANLGCDVTLAHDGMEGVEAAAKQRFDAILMDCQMPEMDGYEATRQIHALLDAHERARTPVIALTANAMEEDQRRCLEAGMTGFLSKPVRIEELRKLLDSLPDSNPAGAADPTGSIAAR